MAKYDYDLVTIGGGAAGLTASTFAGQSAAKTLLIEKEKKLGGDCLHYGCVPSKTLIKSAYAYNVMRQAEKYGFSKAELPPIDFQKIRRRIEKVINTIQEHDEPGYLADKYNVETRFGQPKFMDSHTIELNGQRVTSRYFVIATGSSAVIPPIEGIEDVPYLTNANIFSLEQLPKSLVVLGGGPIGLEMAQAFSRLGSKVTVVEAASRVLVKEDEDVSSYTEDFLRAEGLELRIETKVSRVIKKENQIQLSLEKKGQKNLLAAEALLVATGRIPNVNSLELENAGVKFTPKGIVVDDKMRTTARHIFAVGDVNGSFPFTHVASYEAVVAIYNAILKIPKRADYTNVPWCTYLDPEIASIGFNELRAKESGISYTVHKEWMNHNDRALAEGETKGFIKLIMNKKGRLYGAQIVGYHAGDLIHEWVPVLNGTRKLSLITNAMHAYPTMAEINKNSSVNYLVSTIPGWTKKLTKFMFGYQGKA